MKNEQESLFITVIIPMVLQIRETIVLQGAELDGKVRLLHLGIFGS
jgi:hypothetical protein